jgi:hypothetical protein
MPHSRLLTGLFIVASVVVDFVLLAAAWGNPDVYHYHALLEGIALGQVGALAIWTVTGRIHRLVRGTCLVLATGLLALVTQGEQTWYFSRWLALLACYAIIVVAVLALVEFARRAVASRQGEEEAIRTPLIELFGWTIVVAIASFGARYMNFQVLENGLAQLPTTLAILAVPVLAEFLYRPKFQPLQLLKWLVFVGGAGAVGYYLASRRLTATVFMTQAAYLAAWMIVRSVENDVPVAEEKLKIYDEEAAPDSKLE